MTVVYHCLTCEDIIRSKLGLPGFEPPTTRFEYFSDAHKHMIEWPNHWMETKIETDDEE